MLLPLCGALTQLQQAVWREQQQRGSSDDAAARPQQQLLLQHDRCSWHQQQQLQQHHHCFHHQQQHHYSSRVDAAAAAGLHTRAAPAPAQPLSEQQQADLAAAILGSFKQDSATAAGVLARALSNQGKRDLLAALERSERPELSRTVMVDEPDSSSSGGTGGTTTSSSSSPSSSSSSSAHPLHDAAAAAADAAAAAVAPPEEPTVRQLLRVGVTKGLPFVAFGLFDNVIMITAGEQIDLMFGAKMGLSSMAAAGLGNTVADVVGINISQTIEQKFKRMKSMAPALTKAQLALPRTQRAKVLGCAIGMATGCLLGLTPLLFYDATHGSHHPTATPAAAAVPAAAAAQDG